MRSHDGGRTWGEYRVEFTAGPGDVNIYHPSLLLLPDNELLLSTLIYHKLEWDHSAVPSVSRHELLGVAKVRNPLRQRLERWRCRFPFAQSALRRQE